jgi:hypothetical protein
MGLGKYEVVYHEERSLCMWHVVECGSQMRGAHSIHLELVRTNNKSPHAYSVVWAK